MTFTPRAAWTETPEPVRTAVAEALGAPIVGHTDLHGGMSPGPAAGLRLADGRQVFVKAVSAEVRAHNHAMIRQESAASKRRDLAKLGADNPHKSSRSRNLPLTKGADRYKAAGGCGLAR